MYISPEAKCVVTENIHTSNMEGFTILNPLYLPEIPN